ncbi:uncharacterized protein LOC125491395 [Plutella xylostella]|uniref:uncharacterized protein LOC125491395 n=1 Tax=Plutella xylostella TaxID=51655 RepID=UPI002032878A|nr:uncharacterized protein LOC125491395 [Plutella xylostella]
MDNESFIIEQNFDTWNEFVASQSINKHCLLTLHVNIRSMLKNFDHLEYTILNCKKTVHLIVITEANINDNCKQLYQLENYNMYTELRNHRKGGGIILYIHNSLEFNRSNSCTYNFECITGEIKTLYNYKLGICAVYRPPEKSIPRFIDELTVLNRKYAHNNNLMIIGDMNIDLKKINMQRNQYLNKLSELGDIITKSCIDHIFMRSVGNCDVHTAVINIAPADHCITGCLIKDNTLFTPSPTANKTVTKLNHQKLKLELKNIDWSSTLEMKNPNDILNFIIDKFTLAYEKCKYSVKLNYDSKRKKCMWIDKKLIYMFGMQSRYNPALQVNRFKYI